MAPSDEIRMLPKEFPRDPFQASLVDAVLGGQIPMRELPREFMIPGIGFHQSLYALTVMHVGYIRQGRQAFVVPQGMQESLARTSLDHVGARDIQLPYPYLYVALPDCKHKVWGGERTRWHQAGGAYLYFTKNAPLVVDPVTSSWVTRDVDPETYPGSLTIYIWGMENEESEIVGDDASLYLTIDFQEMIMSGEDLESYIRSLLSDDTRAYQSPGMPNEVKEALGADLPADPRIRNEVTENTQRILRIIFNALLYMGSTEAELDLDPGTVEADRKRAEFEESLKRLKSPGKRKKVERKMAALPPDRVVWIGRSTPTESEREEAAGQEGGGPRTWVRGHWWPRKDTIRRRIQVSEFGVGIASSDLEYQRHVLANLAADQDRGKVVTAIMDLEDRLAEEEATHEALIEDLNQELRWVRPYLHNRDSPDEVEGHTYQL